MSGMYDAGIDGRARFAGKGYLFCRDTYVRYDWASLRQDEDWRPLSVWKLPGGFASGIDAAINGQGAFAGKALFIKAHRFLLYDWEADAPEGAERSLAQLGLRDGFETGVDAALEGRGGYAGKAYFFKGARYLRYDWALGKVDQEPKALEVWKLPGPLAGGVDATFNGAASREDYAYFFTGNHYVRYSWSKDAPDPDRIRPITDMRLTLPGGAPTTGAGPAPGYDRAGEQGRSWARPTREGALVGEIYFATGDYQLATPDDTEALESIVSFYEPLLGEDESRTLRMRYLGFADYRPYHEAGGNEILAQRRADEVKTYVSQHSIASASNFEQSARGMGVDLRSKEMGNSAAELDAFRRTMVFASPMPKVKVPVPPVDPGLPRDTKWKARVLEGGSSPAVFPVPALVWYELEVTQAAGGPTQRYQYRGFSHTEMPSVSVSPTKWSEFSTATPIRVTEFEGWGIRSETGVDVRYTFLGEDARGIATVSFRHIGAPSLGGGGFHPDGPVIEP